jgi:hypothetical protein
MPSKTPVSVPSVARLGAPWDGSSRDTSLEKILRPDEGALDSSARALSRSRWTTDRRSDPETGRPFRQATPASANTSAISSQVKNGFTSSMTGRNARTAPSTVLLQEGVAALLRNARSRNAFSTLRRVGAEFEAILWTNFLYL